MTDKQIIIDGVDVSKCIYFQKEDDEYTCGAEECNGAIVACRACDNCYYKQLKAKEQECEFSNLKIIQLQETLSQYETDLSTKDCIVETCKAQYKELKAENEDLKKQVDDLLHKPEIQDKIIWKIDNEALLGSKDVYIYKLEKTLTEIKEIARVNSINTCWSAIDLCADCDEIKDCGLQSPFEKLKAIRQKISEVEHE